MGTGTLSIDLDAIGRNWRALDRLSAATVETGAVVKADGYGLGAARVARALARAGARRFFVAVAEEGAEVRAAVGPGPEIFVLAGHMPGDAEMIADLALIPVLAGIEQLTRHLEVLPGRPYALQIDCGMNRLGMAPGEWAAVRARIAAAPPVLVLSHLACADAPRHPMNARQLAAFRAMTEGLALPRSLAATGGILLGPEFHFDLVRPGIGLYGGLPFAAAEPVVELSLPVIQERTLAPGETVGYGATWQAEGPARIAVVAGGYADGLLRALGGRAVLWADAVPCPVAGRVSMDLIAVDVTHLAEAPRALTILGPEQTVDALAAAAGTIGYEILAALGPRYRRRYLGDGSAAERPA